MPPPAPQQQSKNTFNPQISLVTDVRYDAVQSDPTRTKRFYLNEAELGFAADVDPFLRAEAYIAVGDDGTGTGKMETDVEEAFGVYSNLGKGLSGKFGKFAASIGRVQRNHTDQLNWLDYPLVIQDWLGDEGFRSGGASLSYLVPGERFHELTLEALDGSNTKLFGRANGGSPVFVGHYRTFHEFSDDASAQFGLSFANGPGAMPGRASMYGADLTYKLQPGQGRSMVLEAEAYGCKPGSGLKTNFGGFAALTYQLMPRVFGTAKVDYSEIPGTRDIQRAWSLGATLKPTEFHFWRIEWQTINSNFQGRRNQLTLQFSWLIGAHPAHKY
jgi:hypothetical protein